jgi:hypothetical protein
VWRFGRLDEFGAVLDGQAALSGRGGPFRPWRPFQPNGRTTRLRTTAHAGIADHTGIDESGFRLDENRDNVTS